MPKTSRSEQVDYAGLEIIADEFTGSFNGSVTSPAVTALVALTDNSGGTASNTIVDVPAAYTEATLANQIASLAAKINAIIAALKA